MNVPIFCVVGMSGAGKSTYLHHLMNDDRIKSSGIEELVYHTTRNKRYPEESGYHFVSFHEFERCKHAVVEYRLYEKYDSNNNEKSVVAYYTTYGDVYSIPPSTKALVCATSVDQLLSYYKTFSNVYVIDISVELKVRLDRLLTRATDENGKYIEHEVMEIFRRCQEERSEYGRLASSDIPEEKYLRIDNTEDDSIDSNLTRIVEFIYDKTF